MTPRHKILGYGTAVVLAAVPWIAALAWPVSQVSRHETPWLIDPAAWGNHTDAPGGGRWIVVGPRGTASAQIGFSTRWHATRVEDHPPFSDVFVPAGRVKSDRTVYESEGLTVSAFRMRWGTYVWIENAAVQPRVVLVQGR